MACLELEWRVRRFDQAIGCNCGRNKPSLLQTEQEKIEKRSVIEEIGTRVWGRSGGCGSLEESGREARVLWGL